MATKVQGEGGALMHEPLKLKLACHKPTALR